MTLLNSVSTQVHITAAVLYFALSVYDCDSQLCSVLEYYMLFNSFINYRRLAMMAAAFPLQYYQCIVVFVCMYVKSKVFFSSSRSFLASVSLDSAKLYHHHHPHLPHHHKDQLMMILHSFTKHPFMPSHNFLFAYKMKTTMNTIR